MMTQTQSFIAAEEQYSAHNYHPLDVVIERAEGVWVYDVDGKRYLDCLSAYSAVNQGHCHPRIVRALVEQAGKVTLTSRAFRNDQFGPFAKELCELTGYEMMLPMNSGTEAVETTIKAARKWGYSVKRVPDGHAQIIVRRRGRTGAGHHAEHHRVHGRADPGRERRAYPPTRLSKTCTRSLHSEPRSVHRRRNPVRPGTLRKAVRL